MQIKIKNTKLFLAAIFVLCTGSQLFSYGGNTAIAPLLTAIGGYEFYSLVAPLGATGMMVALPAVAALGRKIGSKTVLFLGAFLMLFGRVGMQFANSVFTIGLFNFLGSFGSGFVITAPFVMIGTAFERSASIKYYGYIATFNAIGSLIGPPLAGMLVDVNLPRISFLLWIPLYVFSLIAIGMLYPNSKSQSKEKFDVTGWLYLAIMVFAFVMWTGLSGKVFPWLSFGLLLPVAVAVFAWLLVRHSGRIANPTVPIRVFQYKRFRGCFLHLRIGISAQLPAVRHEHICNARFNDNHPFDDCYYDPWLVPWQDFGEELCEECTHDDDYRKLLHVRCTALLRAASVDILYSSGLDRLCAWRRW